MFFIMILAGLAACCLGLVKFRWFTSLSMAAGATAVGMLEFILFDSFTFSTIFATLLLMAHGAIIIVYVLYRESKDTIYVRKMRDEFEDGGRLETWEKGVFVGVGGLLIAYQTAPITFRLMNNDEGDIFVIIGMVIMLIGILVETLADITKMSSKKRNSGRFVSSGIYKLVRCPNYLGEMIFWLGVFVTGVSSLCTFLQWLVSLIGLFGTFYIMLSRAKRLEAKQDKAYGSDEEYKTYSQSTPIIVPFAPIYSLENMNWLKG